MAPRKVVHLTAKYVTRLPKQSRKYQIPDDPFLGQPGLLIEVRPTGRKIFIWRRNVEGKTRRIKIGEFPAWSVAAARKRAAEHNSALAQGEMKADHAPTLETFFESVFTPRRMSKLAIGTQTSYRSAWRLLEELYNKPMDKITRRDIAAAHNQVTVDRTAPVADMVRCLLSSILNFARTTGYLDVLPAFPSPHGTKKRERWLDADEIKRLLQVLDNEEAMWSDLFKLLLFTGARKTEVAAMRWEQLDLDNGVWRRIQKGGSVTATALAGPVVEILKRRKAERDSQAIVNVETLPWVFPAETSKTGYVAYANRQWVKICKKANIEGAVIHTLRHTFASWAVQSGVSLELTGKQLGHKQSSTTARYSHMVVDQTVVAAVTATVEKMAKG